MARTKNTVDNDFRGEQQNLQRLHNLHNTFEHQSCPPNVDANAEVEEGSQEISKVEENLDTRTLYVSLLPAYHSLQLVHMCTILLVDICSIS